MIYFILFLTFFINKSSSNIKVQRNKGPDTFTGLECNQSRYIIEDKHNGGCKCFDTQQIFSSYGKHETGCYKGDSIRKNPDIEHEFITVNNVTTQIKTTLCELNKIEKLFIWDVIYNVGTWNEYKVLEDVVNTNAINITIGERKNWDGLLVHFLYSCKTDNKMRSCVVKFTGDIEYPFKRNFPLQKVETTKPTEAVSTTTTKKKTTKSATTKSVTTVKTTSKIITKKATSQGATTVVKDKRNDDDKQNIGIIVGIIVVVILILFALVFCFIWRRKKRSRNNGKKQDVKEPLYAEYTPNKTSEQKVSLKSPSKDEESHYDTTYTQAYESHNPEAHWNTYDYAATKDLKENNEQKYIADDPYYYSTAAAVLTEPTVEYAQVDKTKTNQKHTNEYQENNLNNKKEKNEEPHYYSTTKPAEEASKDSVSRNQQDDPYYYSTAASAEPVVTDEYAQVQKNNN